MTSAFWRECAFEPIVRSFEDPATHQNRSRNLGAPAWCSRSRMKHFEDLGAILGSTWWVRPAPRISDPWVPAWSPAEASLPAAPTSADGTVADCCCPQRPGSTNGVAFDSSTGGKVDMVLTSAAETYSNNIQKEKREKLALLSKTMLTKNKTKKQTKWKTYLCSVWKWLTLLLTGAKGTAKDRLWVSTERAVWLCDPVLAAAGSCRFTGSCPKVGLAAWGCVDSVLVEPRGEVGVEGRTNGLKPIVGFLTQALRVTRIKNDLN